MKSGSVPNLKTSTILRDIADYAQVSPIKAKQIYTIILNTMIKALRNQEQVILRGFGRFYVRHRKAKRQKVNTSWTTYEVRLIPATSYVVFKPANPLRCLPLPEEPHNG